MTIRPTTRNFVLGFLMMQRASTFWSGYAGRTGSYAQNVKYPVIAGWPMGGSGAKTVDAECR